MTNKRPAIFLLADDDEDDRLMARDAFDECSLTVNLDTVEDGEELLERLRGTGRYADQAPMQPDLILLDLNMPRMGGRAALDVIKHDPVLRRIPVVVLTTSRDDSDITTTYDLGVNSFVTKPGTFTGYIEAMESIGHYWTEVVQLPRQEGLSRAA